MHKINYNEFLDALKGRIRGKVAILGIGNDLKGDDGFGPYVAEALKGKVKGAVFNCGSVPENYYIPLVKENPDVIILLDAVNFEGPYGEIGIFEKEDILKIGFSTHNISPRIFMELLAGSVEADIVMIGVKPKTTAFGEEMNDEVKESAELVTEFFRRLLGVV
jgi:hydrogenase 3 maturation protease